MTAASYADLQPIANNTSVVVSTATYFCNKLKGGIAFACYAVGNLVSYLLGKVHVTNWSNSHGVWGRQLLVSYGHSTGGSGNSRYLAAPGICPGPPRLWR